MSRHLVITSYVHIVGKLWMPQCDAAIDRTLNDYDIENIRAYGDGKITRDAVEHWITLNSGDFSCIIDFEAEIEDGEHTYRFAWADADSEYLYVDCMFPDEHDGDDE